MLITIDTTEPLNVTDRAILAALIARAPQDATNSSQTPQEATTAPPEAADRQHTPGFPTAGARPAFNPTNPIPAYSARSLIANQPGVTITSTGDTPQTPETDDTSTPALADQETATGDDTALTSTDDQQPQG